MYCETLAGFSLEADKKYLREREEELRKENFRFSKKTQIELWKMAIIKVTR